MTRKLFAAAASALTLSAGTAVLLAPGAASALPAITQQWAVPIHDGSSVIAGSSPIVATLDGAGPAAVVGDGAGHIYALHLSDGSEVAGWPASTGGPAVDSTPSTGGGAIFVGEGSTAQNMTGGYAAYRSNGSQAWLVKPPGGGATAVVSGLAVGQLQGVTAVASGSLSQYADALNSANGATLPGWPFLNADSDFTTPALADVYSNGQTEVVEGGDSTGNPVVKDQLGHPYTSGGHIRIISPNGHLNCEYNVPQVVQGSPAVGQFLAGGGVGIAVGTGSFYGGNPPGTNQVLAVNNQCGLVWGSPTLDGETNSAPILVNDHGGLQVAEGTNSNNDQSGSVYLLNGANGSVIWRTPLLGGIEGSLASIDLGNGYQDIVAASSGGLQILDGQSGAVVWSALHGTAAFQNTPLITADPDGNVGITVAGYQSGGSTVYHFKVAESGSMATEAGSWPMFHHDAQLTGDAGTPPAAPPAPPHAASIRVPCSAPAAPRGYWLAASDGGIFNYGNMPFCGSTGGVHLVQPIVGIAGTANAGGYWLVATDGGIFNFGNAGFFGSTGGVRLVQPVVGMARTGDGRGYWLVAKDGGIFAFGDAKFHGSTGGVRLNQPIVGMTPTPDGRGYWLVARDGGIFAFGDAHFYGSTGNVRLVQPIVGMAATSDGRGYWLVASDGGLFAFGDAKFHGSTGGVRLNKPIVGMSSTADSRGYWLVATDGGIFAFGDAHFYGSTGGVQLVKPVVGMAGY